MNDDILDSLETKTLGFLGIKDDLRNVSLATEDYTAGSTIRYSFEEHQKHLIEKHDITLGVLEKIKKTMGLSIDVEKELGLLKNSGKTKSTESLKEKSLWKTHSTKYGNKEFTSSDMMKELNLARDTMRQIGVLFSSLEKEHLDAYKGVGRFSACASDNERNKVASELLARWGDFEGIGKSLKPLFPTKGEQILPPQWRQPGVTFPQWEVREPILGFNKLAVTTMVKYAEEVGEECIIIIGGARLRPDPTTTESSSRVLEIKEMEEILRATRELSKTVKSTKIGSSIVNEAGSVYSEYQKLKIDDKEIMLKMRVAYYCYRNLVVEVIWCVTKLLNDLARLVEFAESYVRKSILVYK